MNATRRIVNSSCATRTAVVCLAAMSLVGCSSGQKTDVTDAPSGVYSFWPPMPDEPRVQFLTSFRFSSDVEPEQSTLDKLVFGKEQVVLPIGKPYGIDMWNSRIYVCDVTNPRVVILDLESRETQLMGGGSTDTMVQPVDIAVAPDGMKYVVDRRLSRIFVFNRNDSHVASFSPRGVSPVGVTVRDRELLIPDFESQTVLILDRFTGEIKGSIGTGGGGEGGFIRPLGIDTDAQGNVFVSDVIQSKVQEFNLEGQLDKAIGQPGDAAGCFVRPKHLAVDDDGIVYVVDAAFQNVQMFNTEGELLMYFGSPGAHAGSMSLPAGIAVTNQGLELFEEYIHPAFEARRLILVTNQFGMHKVSVYAMGGLREGFTMADIAPYAAEVATGEWQGEQEQPGQLPQDEAATEGSTEASAGAGDPAEDSQ